MGASKRLCELVVQSFDKMIKNHREGDIPVLHVHQEDEDGSMYPLAEGTQRHDENGKEIFTFPGQDNMGHRKAQTEYSLVRFGVDYIIGTTPVRPHKQWISCGGNISNVLSSCCNYNEIKEKHQLLIPNLNPILVEIIKVSTYMLRKYLRLARLICRSFSCDIFGLINNSKYMQEHSACLLFLQI